MNYKYIFFIFIFFPFTACKGQKKCNELYKFIFTNTAQKNVYYETHLMGKDAIPCLIDFIDTDKKSIVGFQDPKSSTIYSFNFKNYIGIEAAYLIELILSKDSIETVKSNEWEQNVKPYRIYGYGVIVKIRNKEPILEPLDYGDMKVLKDIYLKWWQSNKEKSIELLRKEWKENKHILNNSNYKWI
jgi:hypothetical protein